MKPHVDADIADNTVHLFRGSPCVRGWSHHQETVRHWSLCGIGGPAHATEDAAQVNCYQCQKLMQPASYDRPPTQAEVAAARARTRAELREIARRAERRAARKR
jgi:hypothetical protein